MRTFKKKNVVFSIKLEENLYSLAQIVSADGILVQFFAIFNDEDKWNDIDLNTIGDLFCVATGKTLMQKLGVRKVPETEVKIRHMCL